MAKAPSSLAFGMVLALGCGGDSQGASASATGAEESSADDSTGVDPDSSTGATAATSSAGSVADTGSTSVAEPVCGNGVPEGDEPCDDGNDIDDDECSNDCTIHCGLAWEVVVELGTTGVQTLDQIVRDSAGDLVMVGTISDLDMVAPSNLWVAKYDGTGTEIWSGTKGPEGTTGFGIAVDEAGGIYVVGETVAAAGDLDGLVLALDGDGNERWSSPLAGPVDRDDGFSGIAVANDGDPVAIGTISDTDLNSDAVIVKLAAADGAEVWAQTLTGVANPTTGYSLDRGGHIAVDPGGDLLASWGNYVDFDSLLGALTRLSVADGATIWEIPMLGGAANHRETSESLALGPDGEAFVDFADCQGTGCNSVVYRVAADGLGAEPFDVGQFQGADEPTLYADAVRFDDDGNMIIGGNFQDASTSEFRAWIARLDPDGQLLCQGRHSHADEALSWIFTSSVGVGDGGVPLLCGGLVPTGGFTARNSHGPMWFAGFTP